ncbi:MAG: helix-turn-helix domain-containing protein [Acidobacteria bacterium]|nr:helix-turn-helix domain-containing protein [Acidobacteriota bacterium]
MRETFGARLRRARERRDVSLADIAAHTKINPALFEGLERDDVSRWPAGIFRRSFMRAYAEAVGLDADAVVREFLERFPDPESGAPTPAAGAPHASGSWTSDESSPADDGEIGVGGHQALRLTLVDTHRPFTAGRLLGDSRHRWAAVAWDLGTIVAIATTLFVVLHAFWMPFAITALCYYGGGILVLGNTPGVSLFAPKGSSDRAEVGRPAVRMARVRVTEPPAPRPVDAPYRTHRVRTERARRVRG